MEGHNTRIIVFGKSKEETGTVAQAIAKEAFHNVSFFDGSFEQLKSVVQQSAATDSAGDRESR